MKLEFIERVFSQLPQPKLTKQTGGILIRNISFAHELGSQGGYDVIQAYRLLLLMYKIEQLK